MQYAVMQFMSMDSRLIIIIITINYARSSAWHTVCHTMNKMNLYHIKYV